MRNQFFLLPVLNFSDIMLMISSYYNTHIDVFYIKNYVIQSFSS